ncbi:enoyl-CoA hydratase/isomerase family protein [Halopenitus persicus]|uniref:Enoyl-CoA hydratase n=1 Tax=Halopenitus persicus TaxID=1048396 RepID=A0A1H3HL76_9EURY|nr:enoyl-CoA hydratase/isomerase family protein [Halopenitus persicus]SDY16130.1 enoyl-CoA hydratase [Halopenitus persicus]
MECANGSVTVEESGEIAQITLDSSSEVNAIDLETSKDFAEAVEHVETGGYRAAIIKGSDGMYCAGGDLSQDPETFIQAVNVSIDAIIEIHQSGTPYIAAMEEIAVGGGLEIALGCDLRIAAAGTTFALPEASRGIIPPAGAVRFLAQSVGISRARELLLTGRSFSAAEAEEWGLIVESVEEDFSAETMKLAESVASQSPAAVSAITKSLNEAYPDPISSAKWDLELARCLASDEDFKEGREAFFEDREPEF